MITTLASLPRIAGRARHFGHVHLDGFIVSLVGVVLAATFVPCRGSSAYVFHVLGVAAIASLFFLQGARLSRAAILNGVMHWRLHLITASTTFVLFPLLGLCMASLFPDILPRLLWVGVLFLCVLPSTVQSSIALTSIAQGNVAAAVCSASASNIAGIILAPLLLSAMLAVHGGVISLAGIWGVILQLLVPFLGGHLLRPWIGKWAERNRSLLSITDRGSILLVVYGAFSAAVVHGIWDQIPLATLGVTAIIIAVLLTFVLAVTVVGSRALNLVKADEVAVVFCGSQKSLVSGVPIANALFGSSSVGPLLIPIMIYYPLQLLICAWLARRYGKVSATVLSHPLAISAPVSSNPAAAQPTLTFGQL